MELLPIATFGVTGLDVTRLGFGTALAGPAKPHWTDETADRLLNQVLDAGIDFIDTAYDYVDAERRIGALSRQPVRRVHPGHQVRLHRHPPRPERVHARVDPETTCFAVWRSA